MTLPEKEVQMDEQYLATLTAEQLKRVQTCQRVCTDWLRATTPGLPLPVPLDVLAKMMFEHWSSFECSLEHSTRYHNPDYKPFSLPPARLAVIREHYVETGEWDLTRKEQD